MEAQTAMSWQVAKLTIDPERRANNTRLSHELRLLAKQLRSSERQDRDVEALVPRTMKERQMPSGKGTCLREWLVRPLVLLILAVAVFR